MKQVEEELPWRLEQARQRHAATQDAAERQRDLALLLELTARYTEALDAQELLYDVTRRLAEAPPDWVFLSNDTRAFVGNASLTDSTGAIRAAIQPGYDLLGDVGQFTVYRKKDFRP